MFFFLDVFIVATEAHSLHFWTTHERKFLFNLIAWGKLFINELSLLALYSAIFIFAHTCLLMATLGIILIKLFFVKMAQIRKLIMVPLPKKQSQVKSPKPPPPLPTILAFKKAPPLPLPKTTSASYFINYTAFLRENVHVLALIIKANDIYGRALFLFLLVNCPLNCALVALLLLGEQPFPVQFFIFIFVLQQFIAILAIHLLVAKLNDRIHLPVRRIMHLATNDERIVDGSGCSLNFRYRIAAYIEAFYVEYCRQYGIRYWKFSIITIVTFCKYLVLYGQILLYSYKMFNRINIV